MTFIAASAFSALCNTPYSSESSTILDEIGENGTRNLRLLLNIESLEMLQGAGFFSLFSSSAHLAGFQWGLEQQKSWFCG